MWDATDDRFHLMLMGKFVGGEGENTLGRINFPPHTSTYSVFLIDSRLVL